MEINLEKLLFNRGPLSEYGIEVKFISDTELSKLDQYKDKIIPNGDNKENFELLRKAIVNKEELIASITDSGTEGEVVGAIVRESENGQEKVLTYYDLVKTMADNNLSALNNIQKGIGVTIKKIKTSGKEEVEYNNDFKLSFIGVTKAYGDTDLSDYVKEPTRAFTNRKVSSKVFFNISGDGNKIQKVTVSGTGKIPQFRYKDNYEDIFNKVDMDDAKQLQADVEAMSRERGNIIKAFINDELPDDQKVMIASLLKKEFGDNPSGFTAEQQDEILRNNGEDIMAGKYGERMKEFYMKITHTPEGGRYVKNGLSVLGSIEEGKGVKALDLDIVAEVIDKLSKVKSGELSINQYLEKASSDEAKVFPTENQTLIALARLITRM